MPLPLGFMPHREDIVKDEIPDYEDENDVDGILAMLRNTRPNAGTFPSYDESRSAENQKSTSQSQKVGQNDGIKQKVRFDSVLYDKDREKIFQNSSAETTSLDKNISRINPSISDEREGGLTAPVVVASVMRAKKNTSLMARSTVEEEPQQGQVIKLENFETFLVSEFAKLHASTEQIRQAQICSQNNILQILNHLEVSNKERAKSSVIDLSSQIQLSLLNMEQKQQNTSDSFCKSYNEIMHQISSSQEVINDIFQKVKLLQPALTTSCSQSEQIFKCIENMQGGVAKSQQHLELLTNNVKVISDEAKLIHSVEKESLKSLQLCAENERRTLHEQLGYEKSRVAERCASHEKDVEILRAQKEDLEVTKQSIFAEKENLYKERAQLQQSEALFEQRKLAAKEEILYAEEMMSEMHEMEAKINDEMEKLIQFKEFVVNKEAEAQEELAKAEALSQKVQHFDSKVKSDAERIEHEKQMISHDRIRLAKERVCILKERSKSNLNNLTRTELVCRIGDTAETRPWTNMNDMRAKKSRDLELIGGIDMKHQVMGKSLAFFKNELNKLRRE